MFRNIPDIMTAEDVCNILNISMNHCLHLLRTGQIKGFKINDSRAWRITKIALYDYCQTQVSLPEDSKRNITSTNRKEWWLKER